MFLKGKSQQPSDVEGKLSEVERTAASDVKGKVSEVDGAAFKLMEQHLKLMKQYSKKKM